MTCQRGVYNYLLLISFNAVPWTITYRAKTIIFKSAKLARWNTFKYANKIYIFFFWRNGCPDQSLGGPINLIPARVERPHPPNALTAGLESWLPRRSPTLKNRSGPPELPRELQLLEGVQPPIATQIYVIMQLVLLSSVHMFVVGGVDGVSKVP